MKMWRIKTRLERFASTVNNPEAFPGLTVTCGESSWLCRKVILCQQSEWFQRTCSGRLNEGGAATIELQEDDSEAVGAMLRFCYVAEVDFEAKDIEYVIRLFANAEKFLGQLRWSAESSDPERIVKSRIVRLILSESHLMERGNEAFDKFLATTGEIGADMTKAVVHEQQRQEQELKIKARQAAADSKRRCRCPDDVCPACVVPSTVAVNYTHQCPDGSTCIYSGSDWLRFYEAG
ncbi:hypothetical protein DOTSEDRAFT_37367 [Dothistroma septosporum NZE10]|uniref:BTB domain-containing protein n=1 Tax=Dothistroma septosporum (strain NZE10 / CBS 128990) TaxID=675120 RepID=N1PDW7_DOTSN|nr:hypothetical protein DOTSEDRAFT_37367 [Dothistroma septosporum NZE10]